MDIIKKALNLATKFFEYIGMIFLVAMVVIVSYQVFARQFLGFTPHWSEEVSLIMMIWFGFIGIAIGVKKGIHLSIEYFVSLLPQSYQKIILKIDDVLSGVFGLFLLIYGSKLIKATAGSTLPATRWVTSTLYYMVPLSGIMIILYSLAKLFGIEDEGDKVESTEKEVKA